MEITEGASLGVIVGGFMGGAGSPLAVLTLSLVLLFGGELMSKDIETFKYIHHVQGNEER